MKITRTQAIITSGIDRKAYYQMMERFPELETLLLDGLVCRKFLNKETIAEAKVRIKPIKKEN